VGHPLPDGRRVLATGTQVIPFFAFPPEVRRVIYTTNALESLNARVRTIITTRGHFPTDEAATPLIWLALRNITSAWSRTAPAWRPAMNQFAILYEDRFLAPQASYARWHRKGHGRCPHPSSCLRKGRRRKERLDSLGVNHAPHTQNF
jgi:hypothetical protein